MIIENGKLISWIEGHEIMENQALYLKDGKIDEIDTAEKLAAKYPHAERVDARGQYILPGSICAHTHFYGAYARGLAIPGAAPENFTQILNKLWWPLDKALDEDSVRVSAEIHLIDAIKHGTTSLFDHHASPNYIDGSLDVIADAVEQSGLRAVLCYEVTDRGGKAEARAGIQENLRFIKRTASRQLAEGRIQATFGLHASLTLDDDTLEACASAMPEGYGVHVHAAEDLVDETDSLKRSGLRTAARLNQFGLLGPESILVHGVHFDDSEIELLAQTQTWLTHQPRSNMNNAVGVAPVEAMLQKGVRVCLGNDGFSQDLWTEWKTAYLLHKLAHHDPRRMNGMDVVQMAIHHNAALASRFFKQAIGYLEPGAAADLIFVDYHPNTPMSAGNLAWHILFGFNESMVNSTMVAGRFLMKDKQLLTLDEAEIAARSRQLAPAVWARYQQFASQ